MTLLLCFALSGSLADDYQIILTRFESRSEAVAAQRWGECVRPSADYA